MSASSSVSASPVSATSRVPILAALLFVACGPKKVDPLTAYQEALAGVATAPVPESWGPEANLVIGNPLVAKVFGLGISRMIGRLPPALDAPLGEGPAKLRVLPDMGLPSSSVARSSACLTCFEVSVSVDGKARAHLSAEGGLPKNLLPARARRGRQMPAEFQMPAPYLWRAEASAIYEVVLREEEGHARLEAVPFGDGWTRSLTLTPTRDRDHARLSAPIDAQLQAWFAQATLPPISLAELPTGGEVSTRSLRLRGWANGLSVEQSYEIVNPMTIRGVTPVREQWSVQAPAETVLALLRAYAMRDATPDSAWAEPVTVGLDDGMFRIGFRIWEPGSRDPTAVTVGGTLGGDATGKLVPFIDVRALSPEGTEGGDASGLVATHGLDALVETAFSRLMPVSHDVAPGEGMLVLELTEAEASGGMLKVRGGVMWPIGE